MNILILSDIHGNLPALEQILEDAGPVDQIINAGDTVGYGPWPNECINRSRELNFHTVVGNHDIASASGIAVDFNPHAEEAVHLTHRLLYEENRKYLESLTVSLELVLEGHKMAVYHGSPRDPLNEYIYPNEGDGFLKSFLLQTHLDLLILGHTHIPFIRRIGKGYIINPGSVGQPRDGDPMASYIILELRRNKLETVKLRRVAYPIEVVKKMIIQKNFPRILVQRLFLGW